MDDNFEKRKKVIYDFICDDLYVPMKLKEIDRYPSGTQRTAHRAEGGVGQSDHRRQDPSLSKGEILAGRSGQAYRSISGPSKRLWVCECRR